MANPKLEFIQSLRGWMRENDLEEIDIKAYKNGKVHLIEGDKDTIFLSKKLHNEDISPISDFQIILIDDTNLCLCKKGDSGKIVGKIKTK